MLENSLGAYINSHKNCVRCCIYIDALQCFTLSIITHFDTVVCICCPRMSVHLLLLYILCESCICTRVKDITSTLWMRVINACAYWQWCWASLVTDNFRARIKQMWTLRTVSWQIHRGKGQARDLNLLNGVRTLCSISNKKDMWMHLYMYICMWMCVYACLYKSTCAVSFQKL